MHEHYVFAADGSIRWQEWSEQAFFTETGEIKDYQGVGRDITERVLAEEGTLRAYDETIEGWSNALELRDEETEGHSQRVTEMTLNIARMMNVKTDELVHVRRGALLHDIGKMGIPDAILLKPGKLTVEEWAVMRKHPVYAYDMLAPIDYLRPALDIPYCHHEKFDGTGYPRGLKGEEIPLPARIFAVVDVYDALTSDRPYRKAWSKEEALKYIHEESGTHFDPQVVEAFLKTINAYNGKI
jgi:putative nucleotidyltransferase with HDIG domain